jgi:Fe-S cluster assembly protein SufB
MMSDLHELLYELKKREDFEIKVNVKPAIKLPAGLNKKLIYEISEAKNEPAWMTEHRIKSFEIFEKWHEPDWGVSREELDLSKIVPYVKPNAKKTTTWEEVPEEIKQAFDKLGIPEAERKYLAGVGAQFDSEMIYKNIKEELKKLGVIFTDIETAVREYPDLVKEYFMKLVPPTDNKYAALHGALWSGGTFLYVPKGVKVPLPLQSYFLFGNPGGGQFEHTVIIADEGSEVTYIEGCTAPKYDVVNLHVGTVEVYVKKGAKMKYLTMQNWSKNMFNLEIKRAITEDDAVMTWVSGSFGSYKTMVYPATILKGDNSVSENVSISFAGPGQHIDTGSKVIHIGKNTRSTVDARSISIGGGWSFYRGLLKIMESAKGSKASVSCTGLMIDNKSKSDTVPIIEVYNTDSDVGHEAKIGRIKDEQIFYLMSRGLSELEAKGLIVKGFIQPVVQELPFEYAIELNRLVDMEIESSIG